jgi:hypothetical protein
MMPSPGTADLPPIVERWIDAVLDRHTAAMTTREFVKAVRALSARYVERRAELGRRSPIDSAGKRAAFAAVFAPLHLITAFRLLRALGPAIGPVSHVTDLGCGTGAASAAWALTRPEPPTIGGIDADGWSLTEAAWNWRTLGLRGRTSRGDMLHAMAAGPRTSAGVQGIVLGWSVNELPPDARDRLLSTLLDRIRDGTTVLVLEPIARSVSPWWPAWTTRFTEAGGRADEWKLDATLPGRLREIDRAAGFRRDALGVRTLLARGGRSVRV